VAGAGENRAREGGGVSAGLEELFRGLDAHVEELAEFARLVKRARAIFKERKQGHATLLGVIALRPEPERQQLVRRLYWEYETLVGSDRLGEVLRMNRTLLKEYVGPKAIPARCTKHGAIEIIACSRTEAASIRTAIRRHGGAHGRAQCPLCTDEYLSGEFRKAQLRKMPYREYLQTDEWRWRREEKLEAAGYRCQLCSSEERLEVHHNTYERRGDEADEDLIVLCRACHSAHHGKLPRAERQSVQASEK
jgi:5-methylcytosine-specific restriction endonuclease McrA